MCIALLHIIACEKNDKKENEKNLHESRNSVYLIYEINVYYIGYVQHIKQAYGI